MRWVARAAAMVLALLAAVAAANLAVVLLLPAASALPVVTAVNLLLVAGLAVSLLVYWPRLRRAALLREAVERTAVRYSVFDRDRTLLDRSPAYDIPGIDLASLPPGARLDDLLAVSDRDAGPAAIGAQIAAHEDDDRTEYDRKLSDGRILQVSKRRLDGGEVARFGLDVTEARARDLRAHAIHESVPAAIWHLSREGRTLSGNQRLTDLFGGRIPATFAEIGLHQLGAPGPGPFGLHPGREVEAILSARPGVAERRVIVVASPWLPSETGGERAVLMLLDVTRLHAAQAEALHYATHDPLTGLPNRFRFQQALLHLVNHPEGGALLIADLAGIRAVNDFLGQTAGDAMLREAARRVRAGIRPVDLAFRIAGGEFAVIAAGIRTGPDADAMARRIQRILAEPFDVGGGLAPLRAVIGHAHRPQDATDAEGLHRAAALALAQAKRKGHGAIIPYDPALGERVARRLAVRARLVQAVDRGAFELAWQPQVDARTGLLRGAEALLRWPGAPGGGASPSEFLPEAETAGLMPAIDAWVLDEALRQKAAWTKAGQGPEVVGVNISPATLRDPGFPARVQESLARHGVAAEALEVEIPEEVAARDLDAIAPVLHELIADGVRLSLDDFGGGRSALAHLLRLPVDQVKLDRSIVAGLPGGSRERAILRAVAALAGGMEIPLLAEGVETEAQRDALVEEGCYVMQGWLFGRAVRAEELATR